MKIKITLCSALLAVTPSTWGDTIDYSKISRSSSHNYGDHVVRHMRTFESPCLHVEVLSPKNDWAVTERKSFCTYNEKYLETDFSHAGFSIVEFYPSSIKTTLELIPLKPTASQDLECDIRIENGKIGNLKCTDYSCNPDNHPTETEPTSSLSSSLSYATTPTDVLASSYPMPQAPEDISNHVQEI